MPQICVFVLQEASQVCSGDANKQTHEPQQDSSTLASTRRRHSHPHSCSLRSPTGRLYTRFRQLAAGIRSSSPTSEVGQRCLRVRCVSQKKQKKSSCSSRRCLMRIGSRLEKFYEHRSGEKQIIFMQQKEESLSNWWKEN